MIILTINSGSSSVKLAAFDARRAEAPSLMVRARLTRDAALPEAALASFLRDLHDAPIVAAAHRIVHGGTRFTRPVRIDDTVVPAIEALSALAPLHNPVGLRWIAA
ncbi:MAG TPA: hypothetical protein VFR59_08395, partial [Steroidobacteraceae bacterium]|nr:hypothetical protein [Steroidobacteraceae bacterium]